MVFAVGGVPGAAAAGAGDVVALAPAIVGYFQPEQLHLLLVDQAAGSKNR